jgi:hypothetical protein
MMKVSVIIPVFHKEAYGIDPAGGEAYFRSIRNDERLISEGRASFLRIR